MKRELMEVLACPVCKGDLGLNVTQEQGTEIGNGSLTCSACHQVYPISVGIPNLLPPELRRTWRGPRAGYGSSLCGNILLF